MKNIFRSLGVLTLLLALVGQSFATVYTVPGKVRYAIELKKMTGVEAQQAVSDGYVDLWTYAYFDQAFVDAGMIGVTNGQISSFLIQFTPTTHAYMITDKDGNLDKTGSVARFAPSERRMSDCNRPTSQQPADEDGQVTPTFVAGSCCPVGIFGASGGQSGTISSRDLPYVTETVTINGETWYALKLYKIRYEYLQAKSFYTTFYTGAPAGETDETCRTDASTFSISYNSQDNPIHPPQWPFGDNHDWSRYIWSPDQITDPVKDRFAFVTGGVEIIADPEFSLTASATCGGSDLSGTFQVSNWNGKDWSNYTAARMYVNTAGGVRKDVSAQTTVNPVLPLGTASSTDKFTYSLTPAAYMVNGAPADSLIWAFEDAKTMLI